MKRKFWNWIRNEGEPAVLVLNGEDEESTEQIYRELTERIQNRKP